jgi:hypothetical protein
MPALNVNFTEDELNVLRRRSRECGLSLSKLVHDAAVHETDRANHQAKVADAAAEVIRTRAGLLKRLADA